MSNAPSHPESMIPDSNQDTLFMFPERCSMGVVESKLSASPLPIQFSSLELEIEPEDDDKHDEIYHLIQRSNTVRLTYLPQPLKNNESHSGNSLVLSFHEETESSQDWDSPLIAAIVSIDQEDIGKDLSRFNEHIIRMEALGLSIAFRNDLSLLMLLELHAIGESMVEDVPEWIGNFLFTPIYYAEFQPRLAEPIEPLLYALGHLRSSKPMVFGEDSIDLTGLLPDGLA